MLEINYWCCRQLCALTLLSIGDAAVALPKHAAETAHALGVPTAVVAFPSERNTKAEVAITGETPSTGPVMFTHSLDQTSDHQPSEPLETLIKTTTYHVM